MTNPYQGFEYKMHAEDYLPAEEQIAPADPSAIKSLMEIYRDTANQLNAQTMRLEQEQSERHDVERDLQISNDLQSELKTKIQELEAAKKFAENTSTLLGDELADYKKRFEKIYRHRNKLADMVANSRKALTELDEWLDKYDNGKNESEPIEVLLMIAAMLHQALKVEAPKTQEEDDQA